MNTLKDNEGIIRLFILGAFLYFSSCVFDWKQVTSYLSLDVIIGMLFSQIFLIIGSVPLAIRLAHFVGQSKVTFWVSLQAVLFSAGLNVVLPGRISEFVKPAYFKHKSSIPFGDGVSAVFLERLSDIIIFGVLALSTVGSIWIQLDWLQLIILLSFSILICLVFPFLEKNLLHVTKYFPFLQCRKFLDGAIVHTCSNLRRGRLFKGIFFGLIGWFFSFLSIWAFFVITAEGVLGWQGALEVFVCTTLAYAIPGLPGGIGLYEAAAVFTLKRYGFNLDEALALAICLHIAQILPGAIVAAYMFAKGDISTTSYLLKRTS